MHQPARSSLNRLSLALIVTAVGFCYFASYCDDARLSSDSADYISAASHGFLWFYLDSGSVTAWDLYSLIAKQPKSDFHLWSDLARRGDAVSIRHFHVPLSFYFYAVAASLGAHEQTQRLVTAAEGAAAIGIACLGLLSAGVGVPLSLATAFLVMLSPSIVTTFTDPSPHAAFLGLMLAFGFVFAEYLKDPASRVMYLSAAAILFALLAATIELTVVVAAAIVITASYSAWREGRSLLPDLVRAVVLCSAALFVLWPGGVIRGGYIVSYGAFLFQALYRRGTFGSADFNTIAMRGCEMSAPVLIVVIILAAAVAILFALGKSNPYLSMFTWLTLGFACQGILNRFHNTTYVAQFSALKWILFALCAQQWIDSASGLWAPSATLATLLVASIGAAHWPAASRHMTEERDVFSRHAGEVIEYVQSNLPSHSAIAASAGDATWRYYLPDYRVELLDSWNSDPKPIPQVRDYWVIADAGSGTPPLRPGIVLESHTIVGGFSISKCHLP